MTEAEWLTTDRFRDMCQMLVGPSRPPARTRAELWQRRLGRLIFRAAELARPSDRKLRLLHGACGRHLWRIAPGEEAAFAEGIRAGGFPDFDMDRYAAEVADELDLLERYADGEVTRDEVVRVVGRPAVFPWTGLPLLQGLAVDLRAFWGGEWGGGPQVLLNLRDRIIPPTSEVGSLLVRDIFGNPFRPIPLDPNWRTTTAVGLAQGMYSSRDFSAMPILADALEEAGCDQPDVLAHCRGDGPHVRGCWVVDMALGRS